MTAPAKPLFAKVALLGIGLIGSSMAHAMRRAGLAGHIAGYSHRPETLERARKVGFADSLHNDVAACVKDADLVVLATPVGAYGALAQEIAPYLKKGAILSDVGSVKSAVLRDVGPHVPGDVHFIPAHPIAGTEQSGPEAGFAELFDGRWCILTPPPGTDEAALEALSAFWRAIGSEVEVMDAQRHDLVLAITSHVPHLIAYNIVGTADDLETVTQSEVIKFSAGGFRDFTRIAASDPTMWRDVFLNNREAVLEVLGRFSEDLSALQRAIRWGDGEALFRSLHPHPRDPPFHRRRRPGYRCAQLRPWEEEGSVKRAETVETDELPFQSLVQQLRWLRAAGRRLGDRYGMPSRDRARKFSQMDFEIARYPVCGIQLQFPPTGIFRPQNRKSPPSHRMRPVPCASAPTPHTRSRRLRASNRRYELCRFCPRDVVM